MKKSVVFLFVLSLLIFQGFFPLADVNAAEDVKIGVILPLSGPVATIGATCKQALDFAVKEINNEGGIKSMGGAKIKLLYTDSRGDPKIGLSEAERLIVQENVSALMGSYQSSVTLTSTQVAERYKVPYLTVIAIADSITERGFKYTFRINEKADWTGRDMIGFLAAMGKKTGKPMKTLGLLYENTEYGQSSAKSWKKYAKEFGFEVVLDEAYPHGTADMTPIILKFKKVNPDGMVSASYLADEILLIKTMAETKWRPKAIVSAGGGEVQPEFFASVGDLAEHHYSIIPFAEDLLEVKPWAKKMAEEYKKEYGQGLSANAIMPYANMYVMKDVLERAGSPDREKIRDAFTKTNLTEGRAFVLPFPKIAFGPDGQNNDTRLIVCQIQKRKLRIVYPDHVVVPGVKPVWPIPSWAEEKK